MGSSPKYKRSLSLSSSDSDYKNIADKRRNHKIGVSNKIFMSNAIVLLNHDIDFLRKKNASLENLIKEEESGLQGILDILYSPDPYVLEKRSKSYFSEIYKLKKIIETVEEEIRISRDRLQKLN